MHTRPNYPALLGLDPFSKHAPSDPRVDLDKIKMELGEKFPTNPDEENRVWYQIYKEVEAEPAIVHTHREFLFTRDYAAFAILFLVGFGAAAIFMVQTLKVSLTYCAILLVQYLIVRHAAMNHGVRLVTTVLAHKAAKLP